jgi:hypothetical protein
MRPCLSDVTGNDVTGNDVTQMQMNVHAGRLAVFFLTQCCSPMTDVN